MSGSPVPDVRGVKTGIVGQGKLQPSYSSEQAQGHTGENSREGPIWQGSYYGPAGTSCDDHTIAHQTTASRWASCCSLLTFGFYYLLLILLSFCRFPRHPLRFLLRRLVLEGRRSLASRPTGSSHLVPLTDYRSVYQLSKPWRPHPHTFSHSLESLPGTRTTT